MDKPVESKKRSAAQAATTAAVPPLVEGPFSSTDASSKLVGAAAKKHHVISSKSVGSAPAAAVPTSTPLPSEVIRPSTSNNKQSVAKSKATEVIDIVDMETSHTNSAASGTIRSPTRAGLRHTNYSDRRPLAIQLVTEGRSSVLDLTELYARVNNARVLGREDSDINIPEDEAISSK